MKDFFERLIARNVSSQTGDEMIQPRPRFLFESITHNPVLNDPETWTPLDEDAEHTGSADVHREGLAPVQSPERQLNKPLETPRAPARRVEPTVPSSRSVALDMTPRSDKATPRDPVPTESVDRLGKALPNEMLPSSGVSHVRGPLEKTRKADAREDSRGQVYAEPPHRAELSSDQENPVEKPMQRVQTLQKGDAIRVRAVSEENVPTALQPNISVASGEMRSSDIEVRELRHQALLHTPRVNIRHTPHERPLVNVTVGHIDVSAVTPPQPVQPDVKRTLPKLSLNDYLRARNGDVK